MDWCGVIVEARAAVATIVLVVGVIYINTMTDGGKEAWGFSAALEP